jgi:hypothetical protein
MLALSFRVSAITRTGGCHDQKSIATGKKIPLSKNVPMQLDALTTHRLDLLST